jgi:ketosteroid isomerase-like protein
MLRPMTTSEEMTTLLANIYESISTGDASAYVATLSEDVVAIGTDEAEWWVGRDALEPVMEIQLKEMSAAGISFTAGEPVVRESGDVAWLADRPTIHLPDGSSQRLRATFVASRESGQFVVRQMHLSAPMSNEEVVQMALTTE